MVTTNSNLIIVILIQMCAELNELQKMLESLKLHLLV
jgi:hypothetical protein